LAETLERLEQKPQRALQEIGKIMTPDIRLAAPKNTGKLRKSIGSWYRKHYKDLHIGAKIFYAAPVERRFKDYLLSTVKKRLTVIQQIITKSLEDLGR
jgi:hypothetical protein